MVTLMMTGNSSGTTGRCDERCYNARHSECKCCCGGKNHGVGKSQAEANIKEWVESHLPEGCELPKGGLQPSLFALIH